MKENLRLLNAYMKQIQRHLLLSREEETELLTKYLNTGCKQAEEKLVISNLRIVAKYASRYKTLPIPVLDLIQEGNIGLILGIRKFDPSYIGKVRLNTYASYWVKVHMHKLIKKSTPTLTKNSLLLSKEIHRETKQIGQVHMKSASNEDISEKLGVSEKDLYNATQLREVLYHEFPDISSSKNFLDELMNKDSLLKAIDGLSEAEQSIVNRRFFGESLQEIAQDLGRTRQAIEQREKRIHRKMAKILS